MNIVDFNESINLNRQKLHKYIAKRQSNICQIAAHRDNAFVYILDREGFEYCGLIQFDGGPKLAYEWDG